VWASALVGADVAVCGVRKVHAVLSKVDSLMKMLLPLLESTDGEAAMRAFASQMAAVVRRHDIQLPMRAPTAMSAVAAVVVSSSATGGRCFSCIRRAAARLVRCAMFVIVPAT
jgi:hypothetical protein